MTQDNKKGIATVSITLAVSIGVALLGGLATFYKVTGNAERQIYKTNERMSVVETQITTILKSQEKMENGIDEIKNILMSKEKNE